jgi:hypothetical protein
LRHFWLLFLLLKKVTGCRATPDGLNRKLKKTNLKKEYRITTKVNPDALDLKNSKKRKPKKNR